MDRVMRLLPSPAIANQTPYALARHGAPVDLKLDGNEGRAPARALLTTLSGGDPETLLRRYPDAGALEALLAARLGVASEQVLVTAGVDDALDRACRALLGPGRELVLPRPTFEMLERYARLTGAEVTGVPWPRGPYPIDEVLAASTPATAAIAVVSPNNPTGAVASAEDLRRLATAVPHAALLVDLAYGEFADEDLTPVALSLPQTLVFRTLSKAWGMAGLRVGYVAGPDWLIDWLRRAGNPYAVAAPSLALAASRLEDGQGEVDQQVSRVRRERGLLRASLRRLGVATPTSQANFVLAEPDDPVWLCDGLAGLGIAVRSWPHGSELGRFVRITCPGEERAWCRLDHALAAVLAPEALLFDMDGVLADVTRSYRRAIIETAASYGVRIDGAEIARAKARGGANNDWLLTQRLLAECGVEASIEEVIERFERFYLGAEGRRGFMLDERLLCPPAWLEALAARLPLAVVTGRPRVQARAFLQRAGVAGCFSTLVCLEDAASKPDPAPVRLALDNLGVRRAWLLGDTPDDMRAARDAGVVPIAFVADPAERAALTPALTQSGAARVLSRLDTIEELLP